MNRRLTLTAAVATAAASTGLFPLIRNGTWFWSGLGAIIVIAAAGSATRPRTVRPIPVPLCVLASLVALSLYLNIVFAAHLSFAGLFPTRASLTHLWRLVPAGLQAMHHWAPPVPDVPGIQFLATGGIGLVAVITDLVAVRLRRCALAGLPLLVLFSVPVATSSDHDTAVTVVVFCIGIAGYLALLSAEGRERLRLWGRLVTFRGSQQEDSADDLGRGPSMQALAASGRRIGLAAVVLALFVPLLLPGLHPADLFPGAGNGTGSGNGSGGSSLGPLVLMNRQLQESKPQVVLTYHTTKQKDLPYLQTYVLDDLTRTGWAMSTTHQQVALPSSGALPPPPGLGDAAWPVVQTTVRIKRGYLPWAGYLPAPYPATRLTAARGNWLAYPGSLMLQADSSPAPLDYTITSDDVKPSPQELRQAPPAGSNMAADLEVPSSYQSLANKAKQIVGKAATPFDQARALQKYFRSSRFHYSLDVRLPSGAAGLRKFLDDTHTGYCQQFAFAMAVLARLLHIPARVAVGYTAGTSTGNGYYKVQTTDMHAWPELYFPGFGWLPWEPTPSGSEAGQGTATTPPYSVSQGASGQGTTTPPGTGTGPGLKGLNSKPGELGSVLGGKRNQSQSTGGSTTPATGSSGLPDALIGLAALLAVGLVTPRVLRSAVRRRRWMTARDDAGRAHAAWAELLDDLADYGLPRGPGETPRAVARRISALLGPAGSGREALLRLARAEERASYATEPAPGRTLRADVAVVRGGVCASVTAGARWRARLLPASAVDRERHAASLALEALSRVEDAMARAAGRLPRGGAARQA